MISNSKRKISLRVTNILKNLSIIKNNDKDIEHKIDFFTKISKVDKNTQEIGTFTLNLNDLYKAQIINLNKLNETQTREITNNKLFKDSNLVESIRVDNSKIIIKTSTDHFKRNILGDIFSQNNSYGFHLNETDIYANRVDKDQVDWRPKKQTINTIVEFSSPNIAKPLHAGHMRSTFLGNFLSKIHESFGHNVTRINYLGDWGTQYGLLAVGFKKYGSYDELNNSPIKHLLDVYVKANNDDSLKDEALLYFSQMEEKEAESLKMWELFKNLSINELITVYDKLNIKFDVYESESQYYVLAKEYVSQLLNKGIAKIIENNAIEVKFTIQKNNKPETLKYILQKKDGSTLYITRDIAALLERKKKYNFSKIIYVVDSSQKDHFLKLYETVKAFDPNCLNQISFSEFYVPFGRLTNMSTRKGKVEFLNDLIDEAKNVALESMEDLKIKKNVDNIDYTAQIIGNSHLVITDLARPRLKDYEFSWSNIVSKDESAFMCHYSHARLFSLISKCKTELNLEPTLKDTDLDLLKSNIELILIQHLGRFEEVLWTSYQEYEPYHIVQYLFQLVRLTNLCMSENYVIGEDTKIAEARLLLYSCCKQVIRNALQIIGITPLNRV